AVGITFEVGSSRGLLQESVHGDVSFASTIKKQVRTGLATINAAVGEREVLHAYQNDFFSTALEQASSQSVRGFVFGDENDKNLTQNFLELLLLHRVDVYKLGSETTQDGKTFKTDASYVVPANQAFYRIVHDIFQPNTAFRDSVFYDITAWSLVQGYGVQHSEVTGRSFPQLLGEKVTEAPERSGNVIGASTGYAYIFYWSDINASAALYALQQEGFLVRTAHRPFSTQTVAGTKEFGYGSVIISVAEQRNQSSSDVYAYLSDLATNHTIDIYAVQGGLSTTGIDLGSRYSVVTPKPEVALLFGPGVRNYEAGEVWFSLNNHVGLPVSRITFDRFARTDLRRYTTIILVDGSYSEWGESEVEALKTWVRQGGTLITQSGATRWAIQNELVSKVKLKDVSAEDSLAVLRFDYGESDDRRRASRIPGVIFESDLDLSNPLAFGAPSRRQLFLKNNQTHVLPSENPYGTVALYGDDPFIGGHINAENLNRVRNTAAVSVESIGRGNVILFSENPNFRSYWHSTNRLFLNAIFHGHSISVP
ncbi:MAG: DUF4350 domain-containing protein, partial [Balneolales bacterium]|nr:DUF4350 domain-containing protein [Balneolales bacterium]